VHVVVVHLGLIRASRVRQLAQLAQFIAREIPLQAPLLVAGDFNDWGALLSRPLTTVGLRSCTAKQLPTFPSRLPLVQFDHVFARGLIPVNQHVPKGRIWWRMSDHLPLIAEFELAAQPSLGAARREDGSLPPSSPSSRPPEGEQPSLGAARRED
jgi:endonuclease/exonuclease/phosphatase family metal-dependent hydrolase